MAITTPVAAWNLDESSGNAADAVGSNTLTAGTVTYAAGKINNGASFTTGLTSSTSPVSGTGAWSASLWYKSSTTGTNKQLLLFGNSSQASKSVIYVYTTTGDAIQLDTSGAGLITSSNTTSLDGAYHHLVITYDGANNFAMFIDNSSVGTGSTGSMNLGSNSMSIGYDNLNTRFAWGSQIDIVHFFNVQLSGSEITELYNSGNAIQYPYTGGGGSTFSPRISLLGVGR